MSNLGYGLYNRGVNTREPYLQRARENAALTIPTLYLPKGTTSSSTIKRPFQGLGARGVNNVANKLLNALFPPNTSFFKLSIKEEVKDKNPIPPNAKPQVEQELNKLERKIQHEIEANMFRVQIIETLRHLIVSGNCCVHVPKDNRLKVFPLNSYVAKRDREGNLLQLVIKESISPEVLPKEFIEKLKEETNEFNENSTVDIYTVCILEDNKWHVKQEVKNLVVPGTEGSYGKEDLPYLVLRFHAISGEDYGRAFVDDCYGDLKALDDLRQAITKGSLASALVLFFNDPNGFTSSKALVEAESGDVLTGRAEDISILQLNKFPDFRTAELTTSKLEEQLSHVFMLNTAIQRKGERVTAEEIRFMAKELEDSLGGIYSLLSQELQYPLVRLTINRLSRNGTLDNKTTQILDPTITTGIEAIGRGNDLNKLELLIGGATSTLGSQEVSKYLKTGNYLVKRATALGMDYEDLFRSEEEVKQQEQAMIQQQQMAELAKSVSPEALKQVGNMVNKKQ